MNKRFLSALLVTAMPIGLLQAQFRLIRNSPNPRFQQAIARVVEDFPANFKHITGNLLLAEGEWEEYESKIWLDGASRCFVTQFHSALDTTSSWQAVMPMEEYFDSAASEYRRIYELLKQTHITTVDGSRYYFDAHGQEPKEELDFCISHFELHSNDDRYRDFKIELELLYKMDGWQISINMVSRKPDDEQGPDWDN